MERHTARTLIGDRSGPTIETDPDHPDYLGPILIPLDAIVLFAQPGCEHSARVRRLLAARGATWQEHDASDPSRLSREQHLVYTSYLRTPILCAAGYAVVGFDEGRITEVLDAHVARLAKLKA